MKDAVTALFDKRVKDRCAAIPEQGRDEITRAILQHERREMAIGNCVLELRKLKLARHMTKKNFVDIVFLSADLFVNLAVEHLKQEAMTRSERIRLVTEADKISNFEKEFEAEQKDLTDPRIKSFPGAAARRGIVLQ